MNYSVLIDVARNEPYAIVLADGDDKRVYGISKQSKKWAAQENLSNKSLNVPYGMKMTEMLEATPELLEEFSTAFSIPKEKANLLSSSRRLNRRVKSLSAQEEISVKYPGEFIFGVARNVLRRRRRRRRMTKSKTMVYPILAVKQQRLYQNLYIETKILEGSHVKQR
jgi:hypothetical protein